MNSGSSTCIRSFPYKMFVHHGTPTEWHFWTSRPAQVMFLMLVLQNTPTLRLMVEQPCSSWGFKQLFFVSLIGIFKLYIVKTHMVFFNHDLCKCSHLLTNMRIWGDGSWWTCSLFVSGLFWVHFRDPFALWYAIQPWIVPWGVWAV